MAFDPKKHPRVPKGSGDPSGEFTAKGGVPVDKFNRNVGTLRGVFPSIDYGAEERQRQRELNKRLDALQASGKSGHSPAVNRRLDELAAASRSLKLMVPPKFKPK